MDKITTQNTYINYLNINNKKHNYYNKNKFIEEYENYIYNFEGLNIIGHKTIKKYLKEHLRGFKPLTSTIRI